MTNFNRLGTNKDVDSILELDNVSNLMALSELLTRKVVRNDYTSDGKDGLLSCRHAAAITISLPNPTRIKVGRKIIIKDESGNASSNNITIRCVSGDNIDSSSTLSITTDYGCARLYNSGENWLTW